MIEQVMNNKFLVAFMFLDLEFMRHVEKVRDNRSTELVRTMLYKLKNMPTFTYHNLVEWVDSAMIGDYPLGNLDTTQKARLMYYIEQMGYDPLHRIAVGCVNEWKYLLDEYIKEREDEEE